MRSDQIVVRTALALSISCIAQTANAQVVQLPTFHTFSVGTTVLIPDRGSTTLGGINRARFGSSQFGVPGMAGIPGAGRLFGNRAIGGEVQASRVNATATIMDFQELDRAVLGQAAAEAPATNPAVARKAAFLAQHIGRNQPVAEPNLAANARSNAPPTTLPDIETQAREAYETARQAESRGQWATARINYKRAASLSRGSLRQQALSRLAAITPQTKTTSVER